MTCSRPAPRSHTTGNTRNRKGPPYERPPSLQAQLPLQVSNLDSYTKGQSLVFARRGGPPI